MKAARFYGAHDLRVEELHDPPLEPEGSDVLVRNRMCGICGTDLHEYLHGPIATSNEPHPLTGASLPQILGHEYCGVVEAVGPSVSEVAVGQRVVVIPSISCGRCEQCREGAEHLCEFAADIGLQWDWGGLAEYSLVPSGNVLPLPDALSDAAAAMVEPTAVALNAVTTAAVSPGDRVLVTGAGPIGQLVALTAEAAGATALISEPNPRRRAQAERIGIAVSDPTSESPEDGLARLGGRGADVCIECSGAARALTSCVSACKPRGVIVQTGVHREPVPLDMRDILFRDLTLKGAIAYKTAIWPRVIDLIASGRVPAEKLVTDVVDLGHVVADGFERLCAPDSDAIKILVRP